MNVVAIIPARGGSKGIPRKNLMPYKGKPLVLHSTEYSLIPTEPVLKHAADFLKKEGYHSDIIIGLQPTSPERPIDMIEECVGLYNSDNLCDSVHSVLYYKDNPGRIAIQNEKYVELILPEMFICRQELPKLFYLSGHLHSARTDFILKNNSMFGKILPLVLVDPCDVD